MELRHLRAFLQVATTQHFGRAATALRITQPALTQRIQALERELGVQLLKRSAREVKLTAAGEVLLPYANSLIHIEDRALRELADNVAGRAGRLRISYQLHADTPVMGAIIAEFRARHPAVEVESSSAYSLTNVERIAQGQLDAAFVTLPTAFEDVVATRPISDDEILIVAANSHRFASMDRVPVKELAGVPMILFPRALSPVLTAAFKQWLTTHVEGELKVVAEEPYEQAAQLVARSDRLIAFGGSRWASVVPTPGLVYRGMTPAPMTRFGIAWRRDDESPLLMNLLKIVDEVAAKTQLRIPDDGELIAHD
ncbi:MAG TPA: LysR substrate-binding domain-containing protein [Candidatus Dormibacteraeota bacterium]|nr:LysR substrate-binding domain-containing protein [Candidatus Dormibacteraeota bacterium]